jgi:hypothetical protein
MAWLKIRFATRSSLAVLLSVGMPTVVLSQPPPTVYSLLKKIPVIARATFEEETNPKIISTNLPGGIRTQSYTFVLDGENYWVDLGGTKVGKFGDTAWRTIGEQLTKYNYSWNKAGGKSGSITDESMTARGVINGLLTFGITTANAKNLFWDANQKNYF